MSWREVQKSEMAEVQDVGTQNRWDFKEEKDAIQMWF